MTGWGATAGAIGSASLIDDVHAVATRLGVSPQEIALAPQQGQVNLTLFLGPELVLRIPRTERAGTLLAKEAAVAELVQDAGIPTAPLIEYDAAQRVGGVPYVIQERLRGATLAEHWQDAPVRERSLGALGEVLRALHQIRLNRIGPQDAIPSPYSFSSAEVIGRLLDAGEIGSVQGRRLLDQFTELQVEGPSLEDPVLLHCDVIASNVLVVDGGSSIALLDWGCAEWGNPARDLVGLPIDALPALLHGYRTGPLRVSAADGQTLERDALWFHLYLALARLLKEPSTSEERNWAAPLAATLIDLYSFIAGAGTGGWESAIQRLSSTE